MTQKNNLAHPTVRLDLTVDQHRCQSVREEIGYLLDKQGVESITLRICAVSGIIPIACDLHEYLRKIRSCSRIPLHAIAAGVCSSAATLVLLAFEERRCTSGTIFTMRKPFFDPRDAHPRFRGSDEEVSAGTNTTARFYRLFGSALDLSATDAMRLFRQDPRNPGFSAQEALERGFVKEVLPFAHQIAA